MNRYRYHLPYPMELPETRCNALYIQKVYVRACRGRNRCYRIVAKVLGLGDKWQGMAYTLEVRKKVKS